MSLAKPQQNLALPHAIQQLVDTMFAGETGFSGPEIIQYFASLNPNVEQYPRKGGAPSRKLILQDCLSRFSRDQQLEILIDLLRTEKSSKYGPPSSQDCSRLQDWIFSQKNGVVLVPNLASSEVGRAAQSWDFFISHASEDKESFARPLAEGLQRRGVNVWFDAFTLSIGIACVAR